jgi:hypothetical protein
MSPRAASIASFEAGEGTTEAEDRIGAAEVLGPSLGARLPVADSLGARLPTVVEHPPTTVAARTSAARRRECTWNRSVVIRRAGR